MKDKKKLWIAAAAVIVIAVVAVMIRSSAQGKPEYEVKEAAVRRMDIDLSISASGIVTAKGQAAVSPKTSGRIKKVIVEDGERVKEGAKLFVLEGKELEYQTDSAKINYDISKNNYDNALSNREIAKLNLDKLKAGARPEQLAVNQATVDQAQSSVTGAEQALEDIKLINDEAKEAADMSVDYADEDLDRAEDELELTEATTTNPVAIQAAEDAVEAAERAYELAKQSLNQTEARNEQALHQAENQLTAAQKTYGLSQAQYDLAKAPPLNFDIKVFEEQLSQAKTQADTAKKQKQIASNNYESAQEQESNLTVTAPIAGVVTQLKAREGEMANPGVPLTVILNPKSFQFETLIDETDIAQIKKNQKSEVVLDAYPDEVLKGKVTFIDLVSQLTQGGATSYKTIISFEKLKNDNLRSGMNGDAEIFVGKMRRKLVVPILAVDDRDEKNVVFVLKQGKIVEERIVKTGIATEEYIEITKGLKEGEKVVAEGVGKLKDGDRVK